MPLFCGHISWVQKLWTNFSSLEKVTYLIKFVVPYTDPVKEVKVVIDGEEPGQPKTLEKEKSMQRKKTFQKLKSFPSGNKSERGSRTKKWNRDIYSDILEIDNHPLPNPEEEEAIGIITLEDVIEELLQVTPFDYTKIYSAEPTWIDRFN